MTYGNWSRDLIRAIGSGMVLLGSAWSGAAAQQGPRAILLSPSSINAISGKPVAPAIRVKVVAPTGEAVAGAHVTLEIASRGTNVQTSGGEALTGMDGEAPFDAFVLASLATQSVDLHLKVDGILQADPLLSVSISSRDAILQLPPWLVRGQSAGPAARLKIVTSGTEPVGKLPVRLVVLDGRPVITGYRADTDPNGAATFESLQFNVAELDKEYSVAVEAMIAGGWQRIGQPVSVRITSGPATHLEITPELPSHIRVGEDLPPTSIQVTDTFGNAKHGAMVSMRIGGSGSSPDANINIATNDYGVAQFEAMPIIGGVGDIVVEASSGQLQRAVTIHLDVGAPYRALLDVQPPSDIITDSTFSRAPVVRVVDRGFNRLAGHEVRVELCQELRQSDTRTAINQRPCEAIDTMNAELDGVTVHKTGEDGTAAFPGLAIHGRSNRYYLRFTVDGCESCAVASNFMQYNASDAFDRNYVAIAAIKSLAGQIPDDEFFDIRFRFRISERLFTLASSDIALTSRSTDSVHSTQKHLTEAAVSLNYQAVPRRNRTTDVPERLFFGGILYKVFNTVPYLGIHVGAVELAGSPFRGSSLTVGLATSLYSTPVIVQHEAIRPRFANLLCDFYVRSDKVDFFKSLSIRGGFVLPVGPGRPLQSRIAIAVPIGSVTGF